MLITGSILRPVAIRLQTNLVIRVGITSTHVIYLSHHGCVEVRFDDTLGVTTARWFAEPTPELAFFELRLHAGSSSKRTSLLRANTAAYFPSSLMGDMNTGGVRKRRSGIYIKFLRDGSSSMLSYALVGVLTKNITRSKRDGPYLQEAAPEPTPPL